MTDQIAIEPINPNTIDNNNGGDNDGDDLEDINDFFQDPFLNLGLDQDGGCLELFEVLVKESKDSPDKLWLEDHHVVVREKGSPTQATKVFREKTLADFPARTKHTNLDLLKATQQRYYSACHSSNEDECPDVDVDVDVDVDFYVSVKKVLEKAKKDPKTALSWVKDWAVDSVSLEVRFNKHESNTAYVKASDECVQTYMRTRNGREKKNSSNSNNNANANANHFMTVTSANITTTSTTNATTSTTSSQQRKKRKNCPSSSIISNNSNYNYSSNTNCNSDCNSTTSSKGGISQTKSSGSTVTTATGTSSITTRESSAAVMPPADPRDMTVTIGMPSPPPQSQTQAQMQPQMQPQMPIQTQQMQSQMPMPSERVELLFQLEGLHNLRERVWDVANAWKNYSINQYEARKKALLVDILMDDFDRYQTLLQLNPIEYGHIQFDEFQRYHQVAHESLLVDIANSMGNKIVNWYNYEYACRTGTAGLSSPFPPAPPGNNNNGGGGGGGNNSFGGNGGGGNGNGFDPNNNNGGGGFGSHFGGFGPHHLPFGGGGGGSYGGYDYPSDKVISDITTETSADQETPATNDQDPSDSSSEDTSNSSCSTALVVTRDSHLATVAEAAEEAEETSSGSTKTTPDAIKSNLLQVEIKSIQSKGDKKKPQEIKEDAVPPKKEKMSDKKSKKSKDKASDDALTSIEQQLGSMSLTTTKTRQQQQQQNKPKPKEDEKPSDEKKKLYSTVLETKKDCKPAATGTTKAKVSSAPASTGEEYFWFYFSEEGEWKAFDNFVTAQLEQARLTGLNTIQSELDGENYLFDLQEGEQRNLSTGTLQLIKKVTSVWFWRDEKTWKQYSREDALKLALAEDAEEGERGVYIQRGETLYFVDLNERVQKNMVDMTCQDIVKGYPPGALHVQSHSSTSVPGVQHVPSAPPGTTTSPSSTRQVPKDQKSIKPQSYSTTDEHAGTAKMPVATASSRTVPQTHDGGEEGSDEWYAKLLHEQELVLERARQSDVQ